MAAILKPTRLFSLYAVLVATASSPGLAKLSMMGGEARVGLLGVLAAAAIAAKMCAIGKLFGEGEKLALGAGKVASTVGHLGAGSRMTEKSLAIASELKTAHAFREASTAAIRQNPGVFSERAMPDLFRKYPELRMAKSDPSVLQRLAGDSAFLDDASLSLYKADPVRFANRLENVELFANDSAAFAKVVHSKVDHKNRDSVNRLLDAVARNLKRKGYSTESLSGMQERALEKVVDRALAQEIERSIKRPEYKAVYKNGTLSFKGEVGHFEFEQDISIQGLAKALVAGGIAAAGYRIAWSKDTFYQAKQCVGRWCLDGRVQVSSQGPSDSTRERAQKSASEVLSKSAEAR